MQTWVSTAIAGDVIGQIFYHLEQNLRKNQQQGRVISYLTSQVLFCIHSIWDIASLQASVNQSRKMNEDMLKDIPHLNKDTLMPKELNKQQQAINLQNRSNISITSLGLKKSSNRTSNNILSLSMKPRSVVVKNQRGQKKSKQKESALIILKSNRQMQDPQIEQLRGRTETRLQNGYQYRKMQLQHQKSFKDKSQLLASFLSQEPVATLTHDYDGQQIKSIQGDEKIKHYSMRTGISPSNVNAKDNNRTLQPLQCQVLSQKYSSKERPYRNLKPMEMPFFQQKKLQIKMNGIETYKMNEYRKKFGRGYSRMDNLNKTIEYTPAKEPDDPFYQKRHLVDTLQTSVVGSTSARNGCMARRLALPKLHGRYKVLDRYKQQ